VDFSFASVQANIPQNVRNDLTFESEVLAGYARHTETALAMKPDLLLWPESATPRPLFNDQATWDIVRGLAERHEGDFLLGTVHFSEQGDYNSVAFLSHQAREAQMYHKNHLVPFGEYLPFESIFPFLSRFAPLGFSCTPGDIQTVFMPDGLKTAFTALICFEDIMPYLARLRVRGGARLLINQTNDAWYEGTAAAEQHLSHCVFRCVENRVPAIRAANLGVTCFIDRMGRVDALNGPERDGGFKLSSVLVEAPDMALTFYTRYGDLPFAMPCGVFSAGMLGFCLLRERRRKRRATA
jgi:apolipoprotein N-acyltransferase